MANLTLKDHFRETQLFNVRAIVALIICSLLIVVLIVRMMYLQVVEHELYTTLSENNRFHIGAVPPTRGLIYDRNGVILAQNLPTYTLEIVPERVDNMQATVEALAKLIPVTESDIKRFNREVKRARPFKPVALRIRLSDEEMARIAVNRHRFPGVDIAARWIVVDRGELVGVVLVDREALRARVGIGTEEMVALRGVPGRTGPHHFARCLVSQGHGLSVGVQVELDVVNSGIEIDCVELHVIDQCLPTRWNNPVVHLAMRRRYQYAVLMGLRPCPGGGARDGVGEGEEDFSVVGDADIVQCLHVL